MPISGKIRRPVGVKVSFDVLPISKVIAKNMILANHYSGRCPGIKYSYGLYEKGTLVGCVVYSVPASYTLCNGVCGVEYRQYVIELARLVITTKTTNAASSLVGRSLAAIPDHIVVSYADCNEHVGHIGYVYQATNWIYTGQGNAEPLWVDDRTGEIVSYTRRHIDKKARELGYDWKEGASKGPGLSKRPQVGKHRYVYFTGSRQFKSNAKESLRYKVKSYPKGTTRRHQGNIMPVSKTNIILPPLLDE